MPAEDATCPKCGNPRFEGSLDCPYCGIVYDRYGGEHQPPPRQAAPSDPPSTTQAPLSQRPAPPAQQPAPPEAPQFDDVYQGPSIEETQAGAPVGAPPPRPSQPAYGTPPAQQATKLRGIGQSREVAETFFSQNVRLSLILFGTLYILLLGFWSSFMLGGSAEGDSVRTRFFTLAGVGAPKSYDEANYIRFVGRSFLMFELPGNQFVVLYHKGALAGGSTPEAMADQVKKTLDSVGLPYRDHERARGRLGSVDVEIEILAVGEGKRDVNLIGLVPFTASDGRSAVLVLAAPQRDFRDLQREFVDRSFGG